MNRPLLRAAGRALSARFPRAPAVFRAILSVVGFLLAWAWLDLVVNLRYPGRVAEPTLWYLLPAIDVTALLGGFVVWACAGRPWPRRATALIAAGLLALRIFRVADGLIGQSYYRSINLSLDAPMLPELVRLMWSTVSWPRLLVGLGLLIGALLFVGAANYLACARAQRFLGAGSRQQLLFATIVMGCGALAPLWPAYDAAELHLGVFGRSLAPALYEQARLAVSAAALRRQKAAELAAAQRRLRAIPAGLGRLHGVDVLVFFVESYGATVFHDQRFADQMAPALTAFEATLAGRGYAAASGWSDSPTYGGGSWLAHATFATGVRIHDGLEFAVLRQTTAPVETMASAFRRAGYRTVLVQPGTTRPWPEGEVRGFDRRYYAPDLGYEGPRFGWATMPDQYVLGFIHDRELRAAHQPLFIEYALVASHAPWTELPAIVDWNALDGGRVFRDQPRRTFSVAWHELERGGDAYLAALRYDFEVLGRYLGERLARDALVIVLGDHQPPGVAHGDPSRAVPVHVLARDRALVDRFIAAGYRLGMSPPASGPVPPMERFLPELLERLSD